MHIKLCPHIKLQVTKSDESCCTPVTSSLIANVHALIMKCVGIYVLVYLNTQTEILLADSNSGLHILEVGLMDPMEKLSSHTEAV